MADTNTPQTGTDADAAGSRAEVAELTEGAARKQIGPKEIGGREGPEPTRFGDWEKAGRCIDF